MKRNELKWKYYAEYGVWNMMKQRCYNPNTSRYKVYGGRGIKVCPRWLGEQGFKNFIADMGPRPKNTRQREWSVDRIDSDKDYSPENCRWARSGEQARNMRRNVFVYLWGNKYCVTDACKIFGINKKSFWTYHYRHEENNAEDNFANYLVHLGTKEVYG